MHSQGKRGRPYTFSHDDRKHLAELIREHGVRGARREASVSVSHHTLIKIAQEFGVRLRRGRRPS